MGKWPTSTGLWLIGVLGCGEASPGGSTSEHHTGPGAMNQAAMAATTGTSNARDVGPSGGNGGANGSAVPVGRGTGVAPMGADTSPGSGANDDRNASASGGPRSNEAADTSAGPDGTDAGVRDTISTPADAMVQETAPDAASAGEEIRPPPDSPAPDNVSKWANDGPLGSRIVNNSGPDGQFTLFVPDPLAEDGTLHPIVTWGNGSLTRPSSYRALLSHYATHGLFVVASNSTNVGSGQEMIAGMRWAMAENDRAASPYFGKLDPNAVGSIGYSQGGIGAVIAGNEPEVKTTVPIAGGDETIVNISHPIFLIGNEDDTAAPIDVISPQFTSEDTTGPFVFGILLATGHLETLGDGGRHRGYTTAWLAYHLQGDEQAYRVFYGDDQCTLCADRAWETQRKNLP